MARYAAANLDTLVEIDVNPIIVRPAGKGAVAVDAMIRLKNNQLDNSEGVQPMSDGVNTVKDGDILEVTIDRPKANAIDLATSRRAERRFHRPSATTIAADRHHHRRGRSILLAGLGPQGGRRRREIR